MESAKIKITHAQNPEDFSQSKKLILEYVNWLGIDLSFQNFDNEINNLRAMYSEPNGGLLLAKIDSIPAGVAGIRKFENKACELKRMFVKDEFRNKGIGKMLLSASVELAKKFNYEVIKLDTADFMNTAIKLYKENGFIEIPEYRYNPLNAARYFELVLKEQ